MRQFIIRYLLQKKKFFLYCSLILLLSVSGCKVAHQPRRADTAIAVTENMQPRDLQRTDDSLTVFLNMQKDLSGEIITDSFLRTRSAIQIADSLKFFLEEHPEYNQNIVFIVNMKIISNLNRFFVYDYSKNKIIDESLVAHGIGSDAWVGRKWKPVFSNKPGSAATSLGKYIVGKSYTGKFGKSYKLHGLDRSNSNAEKRNIVLHAFDYVPEVQRYDNLLVRSDGCPMVNPKFFLRLQSIIDNSPAPILLYICYVSY